MNTHLRSAKLLLLLYAIFLGNPCFSAAETYKIDGTNTHLIWHINNMGFSIPNGKMTDIDGTLTIDPIHPSRSKLNVTLRLDGVKTGWDHLDNALKSENFFNVAMYPEATLTSEKIQMRGKRAALVHANLTFMGITKPVFINVKLNKIGINPIDQVKTAGFSASTSVRRSDFGMKYMLDMGTGDDVRIEIQSEAKLIGNEAEKKDKKKK